MICVTLSVYFKSFNGRMVSSFELWDLIISFPFIKDGAVCPMLEEVIMKHRMTFSKYLENSNGSYYGCHADTSGSLQFRDLPKQN